MMRNRFVVTVLMLSLFVMSFSTGYADTPDNTQEYIDELVEADTRVYTLNDMEAGRTLYALAETLSGTLDTVLALYQMPDRTLVAYDDDGGADTNARFAFTFDSDGDYLLILNSYNNQGAGMYRLLMGIDNPTVMWSSVDPLVRDTGTTNFRQSNATPVESGATGEISGFIENSSIVVYDIAGLRRGQTVYLRVDATDDTLDPFLVIGFPELERFLGFDDDSGIGTDAILTVDIPENGDYSIAVGARGKYNNGGFQLYFGVDNESALEGTVDSNASLLSEPYFFREPEPQIRGYQCDELAERPELSGTERTRETPNFIIHYTIEGVDGATPSFIEEVAIAVERSLQVQVETVGWAMPPPDCGEGGDERFDIYVQETIGDGALGFASQNRVVEDNPGTDVIETDAAYSYLTIDNNFDIAARPLDVMRSTVAHEIAHNIQFGYDFGDSFFGIYEATAVWMETRTYPEISDFVRFVRKYFDTTDLCIGGEDDDAINFRVYGEWFIINSLAKDFGDEGIVQLWESMAMDEGLPGFYRSVEALGTTMEETMMAMATRNLLHNYDDVVASRLTGRDPRNLVRVESNVNGTGEIVPRRNGIQELGMDYVRIASKQVYEFSLDDPEMTMRFIGVRADGLADIVELDRGGTVDTTIYNHAYIIILNTRRHIEPSDCIFYDWTLTAAAGDVGRLTPIDSTRDASGFNPAG
ncbi:MAG: DUF6055 domain-containing protein [Aggregatilineales bacterium]